MDLMDRHCPSCGARDHFNVPQHSRDHWKVCKCAACGFVYLQNPPHYEALVEDFAWEKTQKVEKKRRKTEATLRDVDRLTRWRMRLFRRDEATLFRELFGNGRVLDIGCGLGARLPEPLIPYGIEISRGLYEQANAVMQERGGYAVHAPATEGLKSFDDDFFDGILARSYLEHETEPMTVLTEAHRALKPGGILYVRVPNYGSINRRLTGGQWCGFRYPDHVNYFTVDSLKDMATRAGFELRLTNPLNILVDDNIKACLVKG